MKEKFVIVSLFITQLATSFFIFSAEQPPNVNVSVTVSPVLSSSSSTDSEMKTSSAHALSGQLKSEQETQSSNKFDSTIFSTLPSLDQTIAKGKESAESLIQTISCIGKTKLIIAGIAFGYIALWTTIKKAVSITKNENSWGSWKKEMNFDQILSMPQNELGYELMFAIHKKYLNFNKPTDSITPLVRFSQDLDNEIKKLNHFISLAKWIKRLYLQRIFPFGDDDIYKAKETINRLTYLRNIFISWSAQQKLYSSQTQAANNPKICG